MAHNPTGQEIASSTPTVVATPLPPLNFSHTGKLCPMTAQNPAASMALGSGMTNQVMPTAIAPLPESSSKVKNAASLLPVRSTLVAPMLPEPIWRRSPNPNSLAMTMPNGTAPNK